MTAMLREIEEQPAVLERTLAALRPVVPELRAVARDCRSVLMVARGSSDNACVYGSYVSAVQGGRLATLASPSVATAYGARVDLTGVLAVGVSQSGRTAEVVETLAWARDCGARTVAVTNGADSALTEVADVSLVTLAGDERAVPATKTFTTQLLALAVLGLSLRGDDRALDGLDRVAPAVDEALGAAAAAQALAAELAPVRRLVVSGRGYASAVARELALKLQETCGVTALGLSGADLQHGPIAVVDAETPALLVAASDGPVLPGVRALARRVRDAGAAAYAITGDPELAAACTAALPGTDLPEHLAPLALVVPGQLLVEALARAKGLDPDAPPGLRKVTQTDAGSAPPAPPPAPPHDPSRPQHDPQEG